jgi:phosphoribosylamine-glycine ligase
MENRKFLFVSIDALISDTAWQIVREGHDVKYYIHEESEREIADGFVPKVDAWEPEVAWADTIVFDDVLGQGAKAKKLRDEGKNVIGGTPYTDLLEDDRSFGQSELKKHGVNIIPQANFSSFDDAIDYVNSHPGRYVVKPSGEAQNKKQLLYVGEDDTGRDVIQILNHYKTVWSEKIRQFQLQKRITGVEVAVGAFFNGSQFIRPININFEHKKLFPGNIGPATGEMGCYDERTEVLTLKGWKFFKDISPDDEFATISADGILEYQRSERIVVQHNHKRILKIKNPTVDIAVTLNHNMYGVEANKYRGGKQKYGFVQAKDLPNQYVIPRTAKWRGRNKRFFTIPPVEKIHREGRQAASRKTGSIKVEMKDWLPFLGFYMAEGSCSKGYKVSIPCSKNRDAVRDMLAKLPFKVEKENGGFYICDKQLHNHLKPLGCADKKHAPDYVKKLGKTQILAFLEWYGRGNANMNNGSRIFHTSSKRLSDDIQELLLKVGRVGVVKKRHRKGRVWIKDHWARINHPQFEVLERIKKTVSWLDKRDMEIADYQGKVYCVSVPNHTLYVRRNGKPCFCGNTSMYWTNNNRIFDSTLKRLEATLASENYVGYIDVNCIVNNNGVYPLEFTSRFGYPTIFIQTEGMLNPIGEFFHQLASGQTPNLKTRSGFQVGVRIIVPPYPFTDPEAFDTHSKEAVVICKKPNLEGVHIEDIKKIDGEWVIAGTTGVALTVCGVGQTMRKAREQAYKRVSNIILPNMYYRRDIGERWTDDSDKLQNWGYL